MQHFYLICKLNLSQLTSDKVNNLINVLDNQKTNINVLSLSFQTQTWWNGLYSLFLILDKNENNRMSASLSVCLFVCSLTPKKRLMRWGANGSWLKKKLPDSSNRSPENWKTLSLPVTILHITSFFWYIIYLLLNL